MAKKTDPIHRLFEFFDQDSGKESEALPRPDFRAVRRRLSDPQREIMDSKEEVNLFLGGQGSGKTHLAGVLSAERIDRFPEQRGLISANTYRQLTASTLFRIREVWRDEFGWEEYSPATVKGHYTVGVKPPAAFDTRTHNFDSYKGIISFINGAVVFYYSLDNYKAIDGIEISWAVLDETKDTRPEAITEVVIGRLRQKAKGRKRKGRANPLYMFTSPAKSPFLAEWFGLYDHESEIGRLIFSGETYFKGVTSPRKFCVIASTYHNEKNLPDGYIQGQKDKIPSALQDMLIYGSPFAKSGGEFYTGFDRLRHAVPKERAGYDPELPLHISFDFNVQPYITLLVYQIRTYGEMRECVQIDEVCLETPRNNTPALCREFKKRYPQHSCAGLFIYGDPSGRHSDTRSERGQNDYTIIGQQLKQYRPSFRIDPKAWAVAKRGNYINTILESEYGGIRILISEDCRHTLADFMYLKEAADGTKHKEKETKNGVQYEKYGHCSDAFDYFICGAFRQETQRYMRGGSERVIRTGRYKRVTR